MSLCAPQDKEYVGFAALPNQLHRKSVKKGFDFTLMVAGLWVLEQGSGGGDVLSRSWPPSCLTSGPVLCTGESGLGKSTLINSLFLTNLYEDRQVPDARGNLPLASTGFAPLPLSRASPYGVPPWSLPVSSGCILFSFLSGDFGDLWLSLRLFPPLKTHAGSCGSRIVALLLRPTQPIALSP